ncbi:O-antigen ligase family protein [Herbiconiux sp. KACC 21604]|uniref:O-antigen ligase family protein n=1 Tax=unclassified Herbiconiux TaxID=2618217 RepID=UPI001491E7EC|nr:O-antigen ligase family protein [Herbiconiux sp. SALV-R1]QJU54580.1 O-antigen ligase family protein [Herbiconiux sp. SALV-R1]WPO85666.1 O-antigen ligase family protein [Herbiconiux sp. KACC 21604]
MLSSAVAVLGGGGGSAGLILIAVVVGGAALIMLMAIPIHTLPAIAFVVMVLAPDRLLFVSALELFPPEAIIMAIWAARKIVEFSLKRNTESTQRGRGLLVVTLLLSIVWFVIVMLSNNPSRSVVWMIGFILLIAVPTLIVEKTREVALLVRVWPWTGAIVAAYACVQVLLQSNPIYDLLYGVLGLPPIQHWSVYRADASLAHPLTAGMFFAMTFAFCVGQWLNTNRRVFALLALVNGLGVISTVSRGSYVAAGIGVAVVLVFAFLAGRRFGRGRVILVLAAFAVFAFFAVRSDAFVERSNSVDGLGSASSREDLWTITEATANAYGWLGSGPGTSEGSSLPFNWKGLPIENSYFQLIISVGIPGVIALGLFILAAYRIALLNRNLPAVGGLSAILVAIAGYAAIDGPRTALGLLAFMLMIATTTLTPINSAVPPPPSAATRGSLYAPKSTKL